MLRRLFLKFGPKTVEQNNSAVCLFWLKKQKKAEQNFCLHKKVHRERDSVMGIGENNHKRYSSKDELWAIASFYY